MYRPISDGRHYLSGLLVDIFLPVMRGGGASNTQDTILLAATVFGSGLAAALIAVILALPCYLIIHNRNQTELKKMKWELKYKSKKE